jgi:TRAP-type C4-dicarboxylate transport system permease small subunit
MRTQHPLAHSLDRLFEAALRVASGALTLMMLVIVLDVALRFLLNSPLRGSYDLVEILLLVTILFGLPRIFADGGHIVIELIDHVLPFSAPATLARIAAVLSVGALLFIFYAMLAPTWSAFQYGDRSLELNLPEWIVWVVALIGVAGSIAASIGFVVFGPKPADHAVPEAL